MKIGAKTGLIVAACIAIVIFVNLWLARSQQADELERLHEELSVVATRVSNFQNEEISAQHEELQKQLSQTNAEVETAQAMLSPSTGSIAASRTLYDTAEATGVEVTEISSAPQSSGSLEGITCRILPVTVRVEGDVPNIISYVGRLNHDFTTALVRLVDISIPCPASEEKISASIQLNIYSYEGE